MTQIDELSPDYVGSKILALTLADPDAIPRAFTSIVVNVDYSEADATGGVCNPIEMIVTGPSVTSCQREIYNQDRSGISQRTPPPSVAFTPIEGGRFNITVSEVGHNHFWGALQVDVEGTINDPGASQGQDS